MTIDSFGAVFMGLNISAIYSGRISVAVLLLWATIAGNPALAWFWQAPTWPEINADLAADYPDVPVINVGQLHQRLNDASVPAPLLVDTRSAEEFAISHLPGAVHAEDAQAVRVLIGQIDATRPVVLYCSVGVRSARVAQELIAAGADQISNLQGSIFEWANRGLPLMRGSQPEKSVHPFSRKWSKLLDRKYWSHEP